MLAVAGVLVIGGLVAGVVFMISRHTGSLEVPDVVGKTYEEAKKKVESTDLAIEIDPMQDSSGECDHLEVEEQDPKPGTRAGEGEVVYVHLKGLRESPEFTGDEEEDGGVPEPRESVPGLPPAEGSAQPAPGAVPAASAPVSGRSVCIDPGHSVNSPSSEMDPATGLNVADNGGATGELAAMWELAGKVKTRLEQAGYTVRLTKPSRDSYASLRTRADIGNTCQITVRLHYDNNLHAILHPAEGQFKRNGSSVVYVNPEVARASTTLAQVMFPYLQGVGITGVRNDCGGTSDNTGQAFVGSVLSQVPVVLIENDPGMVRNNPGGQDRVADAIVGGINAYFQSL